MISLRGRAVATCLEAPLSRTTWMLTTPERATGAREGSALLLANGASPLPGYDLYVGTDEELWGSIGNYIALPRQLQYLTAGDVLTTSVDGTRLRVLWRHRARQNSILLTERCNHMCLMCSQPPKPNNDDWLIDQAFELIRLLPPWTSTEIGFTGGEPTLYGERLFALLRLCRNLVPQAPVHTLSNGRFFSNDEFAAGYAAVDNPNMMIGIPIYGSEPTLHDFVVQSKGAFDDTVSGILNLVARGQRVEIRVVVHKQTAPHLVEIAEFISRNLPFVEQVVFMGLEMIGFARANIDDIWIDPVDYKEILYEAVTLLDRKGIRTLVYNHQLCVIDRRLWPFAVRSISDWKNEYHPECLKCSVLHDCGGFFFSASHRFSDHIRAITPRQDDSQPALLTLTH